MLEYEIKIENVEMKQEICDDDDGIDNDSRNVDQKNKEIISRTNGKKVFICSFCNYQCSYKSNLSRHILSHMRYTRFSCDQCNFKCMYERDLSRHKNVHTGIQPFACEFCTAKFKRNASLLRHRIQHTGGLPFSCDQCEFKSLQYSDLIKHKTKHTESRIFSCKKCTYTCTNRSNYRKHVTTHFTAAPKADDIDDEPVADYFTNKTTKNHGKLFDCEFCEFVSADRATYKRHKLSCKQMDLEEKKRKLEKCNIEIFGCEHCEYSSASRLNFKRHVIKHVDTEDEKAKTDLKEKNCKNFKRYACDQCDYTCSRKSHLTQHKPTHSRELAVKCKFCKYKTVHKINLKRHEMKHSGNLPYGCDQCSFKFAQVTDLLRHKNVHTGFKAFACDLCNFKCTQKHSLTAHKALHSGNIACVLCDLCNYLCPSKAILSKHKKNSHAENEQKEVKTERNRSKGDVGTMPQNGIQNCTNVTTNSTTLYSWKDDAEVVQNNVFIKQEQDSDVSSERDDYFEVHVEKGKTVDISLIKKEDDIYPQENVVVKQELCEE